VGDTSVAHLPPLAVLTDSALAARPELQQADLEVDMRRRAIRVAQADYLPSFAAQTRYGWQAESDDFTLRENNGHSWTAGINMSLSLFSGGRTRSETGKARAEHRQAQYAREQLRDDIRLEVEEAYDGLMQAKKALDIQGETIAQAEEGLRIANLRYEAGQGTLLEVLSAQTALTQARSSQAAALFAFRSARAALKKATSVEIYGS
jgi:outer membrane protein TolC